MKKISCTPINHFKCHCFKVISYLSCVIMMEFYIWSSRDVHILRESIRVYIQKKTVMDFKTTLRTEVVSQILEVKVKEELIFPMLLFSNLMCRERKCWLPEEYKHWCFLFVLFVWWQHDNSGCVSLSWQYLSEQCRGKCWRKLTEFIT